MKTHGRMEAREIRAWIDAELFDLDICVKQRDFQKAYTHQIIISTLKVVMRDEKPKRRTR